ncbi:transmembrane protein 272-like isoform X1 [Rana temporaria]|uniref:transmembrane protein 272-like isoform X1 n=1 Tax=Rana temporaria TaxID=8407 RepID=UPI001AADFDCC|nr:transmembrane protein 272-like isoform X1 [Rana temporaria]
MFLCITIGTTMIVLGSLYIDKCPVEPKIPIYLIVSGAVYLAGFILYLLKTVSVKCTCFLEIILSLFSLCWFTAGSIWVFSIYQDNRNCDDIIYKFTFGVLILKYIVLTFISAIVCLCCCFICFLSARMPMDAKTETAHLVSAEN